MLINISIMLVFLLVGKGFSPIENECKKTLSKLNLLPK